MSHNAAGFLWTTNLYLLLRPVETCFKNYSLKSELWRHPSSVERQTPAPSLTLWQSLHSTALENLFQTIRCHLEIFHADCDLIFQYFQLTASITDEAPLGGGGGLNIPYPCNLLTKYPVSHKFRSQISRKLKFRPFFICYLLRYVLYILLWQLFKVSMK